ncbi:MAG: hypothetical protein RSE41_03325 [Clostridia bacterium]
MSKIWACIIVCSIVIAIFSGNPDVITSCVISESKNAVENTLTLIAMICFWSGIFKIFENTSLLDKVSNKIGYFVDILFDRNETNNVIKKYMTLSITSDILGLGNASTINSIKAMEELSKVNKSSRPNDTMTKYVLLNTASMQLIPTNIIALRTLYNSVNPTNIIVPIWIVTCMSLIVGLTSITILNRIMR